MARLAQVVVPNCRHCGNRQASTINVYYVPRYTAGGAFKEAAIDWTGRDVRFTAKAKKVYAFLMKWPDDGQAVIKNLSLRKGPKVAAVELLGRGDDEKLPFTQSETELTVRLPDKPVSEYAHGLKVMME